MKPHQKLAQKEIAELAMSLTMHSAIREINTKELTHPDSIVTHYFTTLDGFIESLNSHNDKRADAFYD